MSRAVLTSRVVAVFGRRGCGKSYSVKRELRKRTRVVVWDPMSEYAGPSARDGIGRAELHRSLRSFLEARLERPLERAVLQCPAREFAAFCAWCERAGRLTVVVDELSSLCRGTHAPEELLELLRIGRHRGIDAFLIAQRPARVPRDLTALATEVRVFQTTEPRDLRYLGELAGWGPDSLKKLRGLGRGRSLTFAP